MKAYFDATRDVIVITGGATGVGAALARACVIAGATTVVCDVDDAAGRALIAQQRGLYFRHLDVADRQAVIQTFRGIEAEHGHIDGLVCAAAIQPRFSAGAADKAIWERTLRINLDGVLWCYQAAVPGMVARRRGSVIAFASGLARSGWPEAGAYAATETALVSFVRSAAKAVARHGVRVNLVAPGLMDTPQYRAAKARAGQPPRNTAVAVAPVDDMIGPLMFLLSDAATITAAMLTRNLAASASDDSGS